MKITDIPTLLATIPHTLVGRPSRGFTTHIRKYALVKTHLLSQIAIPAIYIASQGDTSCIALDEAYSDDTDRAETLRHCLPSF